MAREAERFTDLKLRKLTKPGRHHDGRGLYLQIAATGAKSWLFQYMLNGRQRWKGLGPYPEISLREAREAAGDARKLVKSGVDPIDARKAEQDRQRIESARAAAGGVTFKKVAEEFIASHRAGWRNSKHAAQWSATLKTYAYPVIGDLAVRDVNVELVLKTLRPIWNEKAETATRVRQRVEAVLDAATARGLRTGENPARWRGHLDKLLPKRSKVQAIQHHAAMPYAALPAFWTDLNGREAMSARALAFTIATAARSGEVRGATWGEFDLDAAIWTIPAERMKAHRLHRIPLTDVTLNVLRAVQPKNAKAEAIVFQGSGGRPMSDATMRKYLQEDLKHPEMTVHGFRSTFRDWAAEATTFPRELAEAALAHVVRDKTEAAYQRGDMFDRRRKLMDAWSAFCLSGNARGKVVNINSRNAKP